MRFLSVTLLVAFFFGHVPSEAKIVEIPTLKETMALVKADDLVAFDFDNTIMMASQSLGGEEWFDDLMAKFVVQYRIEHPEATVAEVKTAGLAINIPTWNLVVSRTAMKPVEENGPEEVARKQKEGVLIMGLTARTPPDVDYTLSQLLSVGFNFSITPPSPTEWTAQLEAPVIYKQGVLFVGPQNNKGLSLMAFLNSIHLKPKRVLFVDNKKHHLERTEEALLDTGIEFLGVRLSAADAKIAAFQPDVAATQLKYIKNIMSDEMAKKVKEVE